MPAPQKVILVTGSSSGFGNDAVRHLALAGHRVYASMRGSTGKNTPAVKTYQEFALQNNVDIRPIELDVTDETSITVAIEHIIQENGHIDVLVHNAGHMCYGPVESYTPEQLLYYYDINTVGPQRVNRVALPYMRKARAGKLVWVGSTSTSGGNPPFLGPYFAAKAGMDSLAVSYASELTQWGIESSIIVPGVFTDGTNHFEHAGKGADDKIEAEYFEGPYSGIADRVLKGLSSGGDAVASDVTEVAKAIVAAVEAPTGQTPFRIHIDPWNDGAEIVNAVRDLIRRDFHRKIKLADLLELPK
ncbi:short-chain dehydrogenase/reductase SDR [Xylogone sp. PMI_703]|nr:short-chain dehydrogenase/reductase SDR [Xylogone sp. PMI_703]